MRNLRISSLEIVGTDKAYALLNPYGKVGSVSFKKNIFMGNVANQLDKHLDQGLCLSSRSTSKKINISENEKFNFFISLESFFFRKFKFVGKGYRVKKYKITKTLRMYFGHSHKNFIKYGGCQLRKTSKYRLNVLANNKYKLRNTVSLLANLRELNRYTKRGLRPTRLIFIKRPGKKSSY